MICQKITLIHICLLILLYSLYCKKHYWIRTLKSAFENLRIKFLNNFSVDIASISVKLPGNVLCNILEGSVSQIFDLGPG